jgi:radical SAM protein
MPRHAPYGPPPQRSRRNFDDGPLLVFYEVTQACDLVCTHCRACAQPTAQPGELSTQQSLGLIDQLTAFPSPPMLVLTGGDPLKRADIFDLIQYAAERLADVSITPSATPLVTRQAICRLRRAGISRLAISIDGADSSTHDAMRGVAGSYDRSLKILAEAHEQRIATQANTTITPRNVGQIDRMADMLAGHAIAMWSVFFLVPVGRASGLSRLSAEQFEAAFERLWRQSRHQPFTIKTTEAPHYRRFLIQRRAANNNSPNGHAHHGYLSHGVNDGKGVMFIGHTGKIYPSGFLPIVCGNYPADHVVRVYQDSPLFRALRDANRLQGKCKLCEFRAVCGGSRARAYGVSGNPFAEEPDCAYLPKTLAAT